MPRHWLPIVVSLVLLGPVPVAGAERAAQEEWSRPVDGPVARGFEPPRRPFGPRHLGVDYAAPPGTPVRAAGDGVVVFAGRTGHAWAVTLAHSGARHTTYAYLRSIRVTSGWPVRRGAVVGESGGTGPGHEAAVVHFGYRLRGRAEDPAGLFPIPPTPRITLAPLDRPGCPARLGEASAGPATLAGNPTPPGQEYTRPR